MKRRIIVAMCSYRMTAAPCKAQVMAAFGMGYGTDHSWDVHGWNIIGLVEGRVQDSAWFVLRGSVTCHRPATWSTAAQYSASLGPPAEVTDIHRYHLSKMDVAVDMKLPYGCHLCPNGYFRGGYLMVGLGWTRSWLDEERTYTDTGIDLHQVTNDRTITSQAVLRLTGGAELNGPWGGVFGELMFTAANSVLSTTPHLVFVNTLTATIGYRFSLKRMPKPTDQG